MSLHSYRTPRYSLEIELEERVGRVSLVDSYSGVAFADSDYRYSVFAEYADNIVRLEGLYEPRIEEEVPDRGGRIVTIDGCLGEPGGPLQINVRHRIYGPEDGEFMEERIILRNAGKSGIVLRGYRFGFRKRLELPKRYGGPGIDIEDYRLVALPFRLQPDGTKHDYMLHDLYLGRYQTAEFHNPARLVQEVVDKGRSRSEGWAWTDGENGLLITKYNRDSIEYSMLDTERVDGERYLSFGGASPSLYNEPVEVRNLNPGSEAGFGITRYHFYEGLWRTGAYIFREFMSDMGHSLPENYSPMFAWDSEYEIGRHDTDQETLAARYNIEAIEAEAQRGREIGCEAIFLGPGWETCEGSSIWDSDRLGDPAELFGRLREDYGLLVGLKALGRSYCDDYRGLYRRRPDGSVGYYAPYHDKPFHEPCYCNPRYQQIKMGRLGKLVDAGVSFVSFDEFDWRGPCADPNHGHAVPTTPNMHARAVADLIRGLRDKFPSLNVSAHDPVWSWGIRYLPIYYLYETGASFDEIWGFDFASNSLEDLLSGKALSLFYYNLAYEIPLHLNISMENDNDNCLAFWWYASTIRRLGIGGVKCNEGRFAAYKAAVAQYRQLWELYVRGTFFGLDELTHIHALGESCTAVVNAFNLTEKPIFRKVEIRLGELGFFDEVMVEGAPSSIIGGKLVLELEIPPFSPVLIKILPPNGA